MTTSFPLMWRFCIRPSGAKVLRERERVSNARAARSVRRRGEREETHQCSRPYVRRHSLPPTSKYSYLRAMEEGARRCHRLCSVDTNRREEDAPELNGDPVFLERKEPLLELVLRLLGPLVGKEALDVEPTLQGREEGSARRTAARLDGAQCAIAPSCRALGERETHLEELITIAPD